MMEKIKEIKMAAAAAIGMLTGLWGWMGWMILGWIACMALDYITGSAAAMKAGEWASNKAREGIWHKAGMIVVVIVSAGADVLISMVLEHLPILALPIEYPGLICPVVLVWYIVTELGSVLENAVHMGAPVPAWLVRVLAASAHAVEAAGEAIIHETEDNIDHKEEET